VSDQQLLQRFLSDRDEAAFELLVWRHGPMILGVCRRLLRDRHHAEDAFQATLLVLARKAHSIGRGSLGGWLYRVAYRVALRALAQSRRRSRVEILVAEVPCTNDPHESPDPARRELRAALDRELEGLPDRYRVPVVLCYLEGLTNEEAACQLGCPPGTVKTRLRHARRLLGERLGRRGLTLAAASVASGASADILSAAVPPALAIATTRAAALVAAGKITATGGVSTSVAQLTEGALRAMFMTKLKWTGMVLALGLAVSPAIAFGARGSPGLSPEPATAVSKAAKATGDGGAAARVEQIRKQIAKLQEELRRAEHAAQQEAAGPPRVATIFGNVPITRDEFAEFLLARAREGQVHAFVNQRILAHACREKGITVTDADVDAAFAKEVQQFGGGSEPMEAVLARFGKTQVEWKLDIIRPKLQLARLSKERIVVTEKHLQEAFEDAYGEKVECKLIHWAKERKEEAERSAASLRKEPEGFDAAAAKQATPSLAALHGKITPLSRHAGANQALADAAFRLQPGEISPLIEVADGIALLQCVRRIPADSTKKFEDVREVLRQKVFDSLLVQESQKTYQELRKQAQPELLWHASPPHKPPPHY
jgi:RNA polymerase sigma factor (sigma-70 family)